MTQENATSAAVLGDAYVAVQKVHGEPKCRAYPPKPWYLNQDQWEAIACSCVLAPGHDGEQHACADPEHPGWF
jgi:hypothetical protein